MILMNFYFRSGLILGLSVLKLWAACVERFIIVLYGV